MRHQQIRNHQHKNNQRNGSEYKKYSNSPRVGPKDKVRQRNQNQRPHPTNHNQIIQLKQEINKLCLLRSKGPIEK